MMFYAQATEKDQEQGETEGEEGKDAKLRATGDGRRTRRSIRTVENQKTCKREKRAVRRKLR